GGSGAMRNSPFASVTVCWFTPRESFLRTIRAVGSGMPSLSTTFPLRPEVAWAKTGMLKARSREPARRRSLFATIGLDLRAGPGEALRPLSLHRPVISPYATDDSTQV